MTRRALFAMFAAAPMAALVDPERLLWTPGAKLISVPRVAVVENQILLPESYTRAMLDGIAKQLIFVRMVSEAEYQSLYPRSPARNTSRSR